MEKITFYDVLTSPFVSFVLIPIIFVLIWTLLQKDGHKAKEK